MTSQSDQILTVELNGRIFRINKSHRLNFFKNSDSSGDEPSSSKKKTEVYIPSATFKVLHDERKPTFKLPIDYIRYNGCEAETDDDRIEYDMDNEDTAWLRLANEHRKRMGWSQIGEQTLERAIDRLEKESHFQIAVGEGADKNPYFPQIDNDAACCICNDADDSNANQIIFCDMCNIPVHQECYGVPYIPEGQWLCRRCQLSPSVPVSCALCPYAFGAFKQTTCGRWAHVICALWLNEVHFANVVFNEPIEGISYALKRREKLRCIVCRQKTGACLQCSARVCRASFHVTCGFFAGFYMEVKSEPSRTSVTGVVIRHAYCPKHYPESKRPNVSENVWKRMINRQILQAKTQVLSTAQEAPQISVPVIPPEKIETIQRELKLDEIQDICYYWALKRRSRFGVPLIRRLQVYQTQKTLKRAEDPNRSEKKPPPLAVGVSQPLVKVVARRGRRGGGAAASSSGRRGRGASSAASPYTSQTQSPMFYTMAAGSEKPPPMIRSLGIGGGVIVGCVAEGIEPIAEQVHVLRLRANLERIRLLSELVRKREKHKRAFIRLTEAIFDRWSEVTSGATLDHFVSKGGDHSGVAELEMIFQQLSHLTLIHDSDLPAGDVILFGKKNGLEDEDDATACASLSIRGRKQSASRLSSATGVTPTTARRRGSPTARRKAGATRRGGKVSTLQRGADESSSRKRKLRIDDFFAAVPSRMADAEPSTSFALPASPKSPRCLYRDKKSNARAGVRSPRLRSNTTLLSDVSADDLTATSMEDDDDGSEFLNPSSPALFSPVAATTPSRRGGSVSRRRRGAKRDSLAATRSPDVSSTSDGLRQSGMVELEGRSVKRKRRTLPSRIKFSEFDSSDPNQFTHNDIVWARLDEVDGQQMPARVIDLRMRAFLDDDLPVDKALQARPSDTADRPHILVLLFDAAKTWKWIPVDRISACDLSSLSKSLTNSRSPCEAALKRARQFWKKMLCE